LNEKHEADGDWIDPLLAHLDLVRTNEGPVDPGLLRAQIEECHLPDRIRKVVAEVNRAAGLHLLEFLDFLPPHKTVLRVSFSKDRAEYVLEIELGERGATVIFYCTKNARNAWEHYLPKYARKRYRTTVLELDFHAAEILEKDIGSWFSYLLSGFEKKFKPSPKPQPSVSAGLRMGATLNKKSA
jgi:hypothetical protein